MASARRPSLRVSGLPPVSEDASSSSANPAASLAAAAVSPQRGEAKLNMLRRMRPPPFQYAWTFYHDKHSDQGSYEGRLTVMLENIITPKPFWEAYNGFPLDSLKMKDSVHFFKRGMKPVWEDRRNVKGGAWTFRVPKEKSERTWKEMLLLAVGEQFADVIQPRDDLCGLSFSVRFNSNLITIWNRDGDARGTIDGILDVVLKQISADLKPKEGSYYYKKHSDHAGYNDVVSQAAEAMALSGKIEEAKVRDVEIERALEEEEAEAEDQDSKGRLRAVSLS